MFFIDVLVISGGLYVAKKVYKKRQNRKTFKNLPKKEKVSRPTSASILPENTDKIRTNEQNIVLSTALLFLSLGGFLGLSLLHWSCIPLLLYLQMPILKNGYRELFKERKIGAGVRDSLLTITMLGLQYFLASSLFLIQYFISRKILFKTEDSSLQNLIKIWGETSQFVWIEKDGIEVEILLDQLQIGSIVVVNAGEIIPVDGVVRRGMGHVAQYALTGESQSTELGEGTMSMH